MTPLHTDTGEVRTGGIRPANRGTVRALLTRLAANETVVAVEAMTGWRFIAEECIRVGIEVRLAEPAETRMRQEPQAAREDRLARRAAAARATHANRLPESWIAPAHILDLRTKVRLRKTLVGQRTEWLQRIHAVRFHHGVPVQTGRLARLDARTAREQLAALELPPVAQQQITVALGIIEHLDGELHTLDLELERIARRRPGCRALMGNRLGANHAALTIAHKLLRAAPTTRCASSATPQSPPPPEGRRRARPTISDRPGPAPPESPSHRTPMSEPED